MGLGLMSAAVPVCQLRHGCPSCLPRGERWARPRCKETTPRAHPRALPLPVQANAMPAVWPKLRVSVLPPTRKCSDWDFQPAQHVLVIEVKAAFEARSLSQTGCGAEQHRAKHASCQLELQLDLQKPQELARHGVLTLVKGFLGGEEELGDRS